MAASDAAVGGRMVAAIVVPAGFGNVRAAAAVGKGRHCKRGKRRRKSMLKCWKDMFEYFFQYWWIRMGVVTFEFPALPRLHGGVFAALPLFPPRSTAPFLFLPVANRNCCGFASQRC